MGKGDFVNLHLTLVLQPFAGHRVIPTKLIQDLFLTPQHSHFVPPDVILIKPLNFTMHNKKLLNESMFSVVELVDPDSKGMAK